ncbi:MAG: RNA polymerase sigma factor [Phycisphaerales bacterium]
MPEGLNAILERAANGDQAAWREIVDRYARRVFGLIRAQCRDPELAEEITQSVFCTVASKVGAEQEAGSGYTEQGRFESWLFRIAMNRLRDEMRRRNRHAVPVDHATLGGLSLASEEVDDLGADERAETRRDLRDAIARLSPEDREVIELRHLGGLSFRQIAEALDQPLGTVLARQHRALKKLRAMMTPDESESSPERMEGRRSAGASE